MTPMDTPAILGGPAAVRTDATAATRWPRLDDADRAAVMRILDDGDISTHPVIGELEADYRTFTGMPYALAHCNGTAALLAAFCRKPCSSSLMMPLPVAAVSARAMSSS